MASSTGTMDLTLNYATVSAGAKLEQAGIWLDSLFRPSTAGGPAAALSVGLGYLNLVAMVIIVALLFIDTFRIITKAGHDGEVDQKSTTWQPLRWVFAVACCIPISGGLSGLQMFILWVAGMGSSLATQTWRAVAGGVLAGGATIVSAPPASTDFAMIDAMVRSAACAEIYNSKSTQGGTGIALTPFTNARFADTRPAPPLLPATDPLGNAIPAMNTSTVSMNVVIGYAVGVAGLPSGVCGGLSYINVSQPLGTANRPMAASALTDPAKNPYLGALQAKASALSAISGDAQALGRTLAAGLVGGAQPTPDGGAAQLAAIHRRYAEAVRQPLASALAVVNTTAEAKRMSAVVPSSSWTAAGSWFLDLTTISALVAKAATVAFDVDPPFVGAWGYSSQQSKIDGQQKLDAIDAALANLARQAGAVSQVSQSSDYAGFNAITRALTPTLNVYDGTEASQSKGVIDPNPLASLNSYGWGLVKLGGSALGFSAIASAIPGVGKILAGISPAAWLCLFAGLLLAIWVPLRPFVEFVFGIFAWVIEIVVAVIGSCVLIFGLLRGDDSELLGRSADKLLAVLLSIALRPALMVLFLTLSVGVFTIFVGFVSWSIGPTLASLVEGGGVIGTIVATIVTPVILVVIFVIGAEKIFGLISTGPDMVMRFMPGGEHVGGAGLTEGVSNRVFALFQGGGRGLPGRVGGIGRGPRVPGSAGRITAERGTTGTHADSN
jgi:conjugal transfer/type IV secretion protein DotA/TraY